MPGRQRNKSNAVYIMLKKILYGKTINRLLRGLLKPFSNVLPDKFKIPVNGTFTVKGKNIEPFKMVTNPTSCVTKYVFWGGVEGFEYSSVRVFCEVVKDARIFFDIGANIGYYSLLASTIKKDITVYAFEPMPSAYDFLTENIRLNGYTNIKAQKLALSNTTGKATFYSIANEKFKEMPQLTGDGGLSSSHSGARTRLAFEVNIDSLDHFVAQHLNGKIIDLIKLDTEANEHMVLMGAHSVLSNHRPFIQCEILKGQIEKELTEILSPYNYLFFRATDRGLVKVTAFVGNQTPFVDYYLVPEEKEEVVKEFIIS